MGYSNGYDSGYSDCEAENRKRWEREAVEKYKAANPCSNGNLQTRAPAVFTVNNTTMSDGNGNDVDMIMSDPYPYVLDVAATTLTATYTIESDENSPGGYVNHVTIVEPDGGWVVGDLLFLNWLPQASDYHDVTLNGSALEDHSVGGTRVLRWNGSSFQRPFHMS